MLPEEQQLRSSRSVLLLHSSRAPRGSNTIRVNRVCNGDAEASEFARNVGLDADGTRMPPSRRGVLIHLGIGAGGALEPDSASSLSRIEETALWKTSGEVCSCCATALCHVDEFVDASEEAISFTMAHDVTGSKRKHRLPLETASSRMPSEARSRRATSLGQLEEIVGASAETSFLAAAEDETRLETLH